MRFIIHWESKTNFINNEGGKSAKNKVGHKSASLSQRIVLVTKQNQINTQLRKEIIKEINCKRHFYKKDGIATIYINGKYYTLNCRDAKTFANNLINSMLRDRHLTKINGVGGIDNVIERTTPKIHDTMVQW